MGAPFDGGCYILLGQSAEEFFGQQDSLGACTEKESLWISLRTDHWAASPRCHWIRTKRERRIDRNTVLGALLIRGGVLVDTRPDLHPRIAIPTPLIIILEMFLLQYGKGLGGPTLVLAAEPSDKTGSFRTRLVLLARIATTSGSVLQSEP